MILTLTPLGIHMVFDAKKDEGFYEVLDDQINELLSSEHQDDPEWIDLQNQNLQYIISALYFCDLGYVVTDEFSECTVPKFWVASPTQIVIIIPDPGAAYIYGLEKAYDMVEELVKEGKFSSEEYDSEICLEIYTNILAEDEDNEEDEEDDSDDDDGDDGDGGKDNENDNTLPVQTPEENQKSNVSQPAKGIVIVSDAGHSDSADNTSSDQKSLYRLPKASDAYRYKKMAQNFYMFGNGAMYMELKKNRRCMIAGLTEQKINIKFATKIPASQLD